MVRLKDVIGNAAFRLLRSFNSTMVRLKESAEVERRIDGQCFNSTMVRLKEARRVKNWTRRVMFQFHNGSIKRYEPIAGKVIEKQFQFHNGSIKSRNRPKAPPLIIEVSIPQWFD